MKKLRVTAVSYLNTKPLLYGLLNHSVAENIDLQLEIPSVCAEKLRKNEVDLGLVPVAILPELKEFEIVSDYCIGTIGAVKTVCICSNVPIEEVQSLYLDFHSRTSVELTKILLREHWQLEPKFLDSKIGYEAQIKGNTAGLIIGDRCMEWAPKFQFVYDLGQVWKDHTGLPFVFACWISNKPLDAVFLNEFNEALGEGVRNIPNLTYLLPPSHAGLDLKDYFTKYINYEFDTLKKDALKLFLQKMKQNTMASSKAA